LTKKENSMTRRMKTAREWVQPEKYHVYTVAEVCDLVAAVQIATLKDAAFVVEGVLPEADQREGAAALPVVSILLAAVKNGILALASSIEAPDA
tara:strand:+ start:173 stop:454 length:282 start_codon:yes stop_codon:yes gene_type:complete